MTGMRPMMAIVLTGEEDSGDAPESCSSHTEALELHAEGTNGAGPPEKTAKKSKHLTCISARKAPLDDNSVLMRDFDNALCRSKGVSEADRASEHPCCKIVSKGCVSRGGAPIVHRGVRYATTTLQCTSLDNPHLQAIPVVDSHHLLVCHGAASGGGRHQRRSVAWREWSMPSSMRSGRQRKCTDRCSHMPLLSDNLHLQRYCWGSSKATAYCCCRCGPT